MTAEAALADMSDALPFDRELANWQGRIANAAANGSGLDMYWAALNWAQNVRPDNGLREKAKQELRGTAERHLADVHKVEVLDAIYIRVFPEEAESDDTLDALVNDIDDTNEIKRLAKLGRLQYERERKTSADKLGIGVGALDSAVKAARAEHSGRNGQGRPIKLHEIEHWADPVDGAVMLSALADTIRKYVIITEAQADAVALWTVHTHAHDASDVSPKLVLKSAQKRSGKTRLAEVLERITSRPLFVSGIKSSALLRIIEMFAPTLLLDEMDAAMKQDREMAEALRGIINSGFNRTGAQFIMNVPTPDGGFEPRQFSTWAPQLLCGIGDLPDTVRDRSIEIDMQRKRPDEKVKRLRRRDGDDLDKLGRMVARWAHDNMDQLRNATPNIPPGLSDRAADAWESLFATADLAAGNWPQRVRKAALALSGEGVVQDDNIGTTLLSDIRDEFAKENRQQIKSETLVEALVGIEGHPWAEFGRARKPITKNGLARLLRSYKITPGTIRIGSDTAKGYKLAQFADAFSRYLPNPLNQTVTPSQSNNDGHCDASQSVTLESDVTVSKASQSNNDGLCAGVTVSRPWEQEL